MADISLINLGGAEYNVKDAVARTKLNEQLVLSSSQQPLGQSETYSASPDTKLLRHKSYYERTGTEGSYEYNALSYGIDYHVGEYCGPTDTIYERTGTGTRTYQSDLTATFLANKEYSYYNSVSGEYELLEAVESNPGVYQYVPGTTTFGDKDYPVYLEDPFVYTLTADTTAVANKVYCECVGSGTTEDPYQYKVLQITAGRDFQLYERDGYILAQVMQIVNPLISPHRQTT